MITSDPHLLRHKPPRPRIAVVDRSGVPVLSVARDQPWDAGDLTLLVEAVDRLSAMHAVVGIRLTGVRRLPTGFWDRLCRWRERGLEVLLFDPGSEVRRMLWFRLSVRPHGSLPEAYSLIPDHQTLSQREEAPIAT